MNTYMEASTTNYLEFRYVRTTVILHWFTRGSSYSLPLVKLSKVLPRMSWLRLRIGDMIPIVAWTLKIILTPHHRLHLWQIQFPWSGARQASKRLNIEWAISDYSKVELKIGDDFQSNRRAIFKSIGKQVRKRRTLSLRGPPHQGKTNVCLYNIQGLAVYLPRAAWLAHKMNAYNKARGHTNKKCRKCHDLETLPHVLNHCMVLSTLYKKRHNAVVGQWLRKLLSVGVLLQVKTGLLEVPISRLTL